MHLSGTELQLLQAAHECGLNSVDELTFDDQRHWQAFLPPVVSDCWDSLSLESKLVAYLAALD